MSVRRASKRASLPPALAAPISQGVGVLYPIRVARAAGGVAALVGVVVLAGWATGVGSLKAPVAGVDAVKAVAAVGFIGLGGALLLGVGAASPAVRAVVRLVLVAVIAVGALTLAAYASHLNFGPEELLYRDAAADGRYPGRITPQTAVCFVFLGLALLLLLDPVVRPARRIVSALTGVSFLIALFAVIGYAYRAPGLTGVPG